MSLPTFGDLGKNSRDIFGKGYHFGILKLDVKTKTSTGVNLNFGGDHHVESAKVVGGLETKYKCNKYGLTLTEKWTTDNQLNTTIDVNDHVMKGLQLTLDSCFTPSSGENKAKLKAVCKHELATLTSDVTLDARPILNAAAVIGGNGWLAGYQMAFDASKSKIIKNNFGIGYSVSDFVIHTNMNDGEVFGGSVYHKVSKDLETGVNLGWTSSTNVSTFGVGFKYKLDNDAFIRAKLNNMSQIGLGYQQKIKPGVTLTLSTLIDGRNFNQGNHKYGIGLELEA